MNSPTPLYGFELLRDEHIDELNMRARLFRHVRTGAELISLENDDENKTFGITFRTPPEDSTGVPHIMEHAVLGGSRKYQVKEPYVELVKGSMKTFVNALTFPDRTSYPIASTNLKDFYNLVDVYLDAVFYPIIAPHHLEQEGWHYELENLDDPLVYKGVVFNEMKGAYSSPDNVLYRYSQQVLFPHNAYAHDAGGDPVVMPNLTYEQFRAFHETYYHPSNARIFFYGDDDPEERLRLLNDYLQGFERADVKAAVSIHLPFKEPKRVTYPFIVDKDGDHEKRGYATVNWALPEVDEPERLMGLGILSYALLGTSAAPLRKALIDSRLGDDITGGGLSTHLRQLTFRVGLKGIAVEDADKVASLVLETLSELAASGIEADMVEAAVNTIEFSLRENNTGSFPRGLSLMFRSLSSWLYDKDPFLPLRYEAPLTAVKQQLAHNPTYLQDMIRAYLLDNPHRVTMVLAPDPDLQEALEKAEKERLAAVKAKLNDSQLQTIIDNTRTLKALQEKPDDPAALATIPRLTLDDLDRENKNIPITVTKTHGADILYHDLFTNGILYLEVGFNLHTLPPALLPYAPLFGRALVDMGTDTEDFVKLSQRIGRKTGGIYPTIYLSSKREQATAAAWLFLRGKSTVAQTKEMLAIMRDVLLSSDLDNQERFRQMVLKARAGLESSLVPGGNTVVSRRLGANFSESGWAAEQTRGIAYLFFLRRLAAAVDRDWASVLAKLEEVRRILINRNHMLCNVTLDDASWALVRPQLHDFIAAIPAMDALITEWDWQQPIVAEGLTIPAQVNYVAKGANLYDLGHQLHGSVSVITNYLRTTWLWEKVRVQGGAYGCRAGFNVFNGVFHFSSYRDPNLLSTLENYDKTAAFLRQGLSDDELTKSIIGAISAIDAYQLPDAKGYSSMARYLVGSSDEFRQQFRDEILSTTQADFVRFADALASVREKGLVVVLGSAEAITAANEQQGDDWLQITKVL